MRFFILMLGCLLFAAPAASVDLPRAIYTDPAPNPAHPAKMLPVEIPNKGQFMNGIVYVPGGAGPFPLVVLGHGLPGDEKSLDLAHALRRAGWAVLTYHYRGSWGSEGEFDIDGALDDNAAVVAHAHKAEIAAAWKVDPKRIVLIGHSMGGLAAAHASAAAPDRLATVLTAPMDISAVAELLRPLSVAERNAIGRARWGDVTHGRLSGTSSERIAAEIVKHGERWRLADYAPALAKRPLLLITAARDPSTNKAAPLQAELRRRSAKFEAVELNSDHAFSDSRIALTATILRWLETVPGAPPRE